MIVPILVLVALCGLALALVLAIASEPGPSPTDVAVAYELAWDRHDFEALWSLSSSELRDGRKRHEFVAAKRAAYRDQPRLRSVVEHVEVEGVVARGRAAVVLTRLDLADEAPVCNELHLRRVSGAWRVQAYGLRPEPAAAP